MNESELIMVQKNPIYFLCLETELKVILHCKTKKIKCLFHEYGTHENLVLYKSITLLPFTLTEPGFGALTTKS